MKSAFDETYQETRHSQRRISEHKETLIETSQTEKQREKTNKQTMKMTRQNIQELWIGYTKRNMYVVGTSEEERKKRTEEYLKQRYLRFSQN